MLGKHRLWLTKSGYLFSIKTVICGTFSILELAVSTKACFVPRPSVYLASNVFLASLL